MQCAIMEIRRKWRMYTETFSEKLKKARKEANCTQDEAAKEIGKTKGTVSKYENGKLQPDLETLATLANLYGVSVDWLLGLGLKEPK